MRSFRALLLLVLLIPAFTSAASGPTIPTLCPKGSSTGDPSGSRAFTSSNITQLRIYLQQAVYCANPCFDEKVSLKVDVGIVSDTKVTVTVASTNNCKDKAKDPDQQTPPLGCQKGQTQPKITINVPAIPGILDAKTIGPKSRCDANIGKLVDGMLNSAQAKDVAGFQNALTQLGSLPAQTEITVGAVNGNEALSNALQSLGVSADKANQIVANNPDQVNELLQKIKDNDLDGAQQIAKDLKLNPDVTSKIAQLTPPDIEQIAAKANVVQDPSATPDSGFNSPLDQLNKKISDVGDQVDAFCKQNPVLGCGNGCLNRPNGLVCQTNNPGAIVCSSIASKFGAVGCNPNNNTAIFPSVEQGTAAMASLLSTSSRYFGSGNNSILGAICNGYAGSNCQEYATFVAKQVGVSPMQTIDPNDSVTIGKIMTAMSRFENGSGSIFTPQQLQAGLQYAYGTKDLPTGTAGFVPTLAYGGVPRTGYYSPFAVGLGSGSTGVTYSSVPVGLPASTGSVGGTVSTPVSTGSTPVSQTISQTTGGTAPAGAAPQPVATLIAQPQTVLHGTPFTVSWSSVGMRVDQLCRILITPTSTAMLLAQQNDGSKTVTIQIPGTVKLDMSCLAQNGQTVTKSATVTVQ